MDEEKIKRAYEIYLDSFGKPETYHINGKNFKVVPMSFKAFKWHVEVFGLGGDY